MRNKIEDRIYALLVIILLSRTREEEILDSKYNFNTVTIEYIREDTQIHVKKLEEAINTYFGTGNHWYTRIRVEYDQEWHDLMVKQPYFKRISRDNPSLERLKRIVGQARRDTGTDGTCYTVSPNLIDVPVHRSYRWEG